MLLTFPIGDGWGKDCAATNIETEPSFVAAHHPAASACKPGGSRMADDIYGPRPQGRSECPFWPEAADLGQIHMVPMKSQGSPVNLCTAHPVVTVARSQLSGIHRRRMLWMRRSIVHGSFSRAVRRSSLSWWDFELLSCRRSVRSGPGRRCDVTARIRGCFARFRQHAFPRRSARCRRTE